MSFDSNYAPTSPAASAAAITPSDTVPLASPTRAIYIGGAGDLKVTTVAGTTVIFAAVPAGMILPVQVALVFDTDTTATDLVALW